MKGILIKALLICSPYLLFSDLLAANLPDGSAVNDAGEPNSDIYQTVTRNNEHINEAEINIGNNPGVADTQITMGRLGIEEIEEEDESEDREEEKAKRELVQNNVMPVFRSWSGALPADFEEQMNGPLNQANRDKVRIEEEEEEVNEAARKNEEEDGHEAQERQELVRIADSYLADLYAFLPISFERPTDEWKECIWDLLQYQLRAEGVGIDDSSYVEHIKQKIQIYGIGFIRSRIVSGDWILTNDPDIIENYQLEEPDKTELRKMKLILKSQKVSDITKSQTIDNLATFYLKCFLNPNEEFIESEEEEEDEELRKILNAFEEIHQEKFDEQNLYGYIENRVRNEMNEALTLLNRCILTEGADIIAMSTLISAQLNERAASEHRNVEEQIEHELEIFKNSLLKCIAMNI